MMKTIVHANIQVGGLHYYPNASGMTEYLKNEHRHLFKINIEATVDGDDREIEFIEMGLYVQNRLKAQFFDTEIEQMRFGTLSCEQICKQVIEYLKSKYGVGRSYSVDTTEDGEHGAVVVYLPEAQININPND